MDIDDIAVVIILVGILAKDRNRPFFAYLFTESELGVYSPLVIHESSAGTQVLV